MATPLLGLLESKSKPVLAEPLNNTLVFWLLTTSKVQLDSGPVSVDAPFPAIFNPWLLHTPFWTPLPINANEPPAFVIEALLIEFLAE